MPPFSRGVSRLLLQLRSYSSSSSNKPLSALSKPLRKPPPSSRPTQLQHPAAAQPKFPLKAPVSEQKFSRLDPRYGFALLRLSISRSSTALLHHLQTQYSRVPQPIRYTISFVYLLGIVFALIVPPAIVFRNHFYDIIRVTGPSMSPYLNTDFEDGATDVHDITKSTDRILLNLYRPCKDLQRGMVVAFRTPHEPENWAIKRIVALEGDRVFPLAHYPGFEALNGKGLIVPFGHMWVEGDVHDSNKKEASLDSNIYGPVSTGLVTGKATHVITSFFSRWTAVDSRHFKLPERVQTDAVTLRDLDQEHQSREIREMFQNGKAAEFLEVLKRKLRDEGSVEKCRQVPDLLDMFQLIRTEAKHQLLKGDRQTSELATNLLAMIDDVLEEE